MGPPHSSSSSSTQRRRLALFSLLLSLLTLTGTTLLSLALLPAAFSSNTPLIPFLIPPRSIVLLLQQTNLLTPDNGLSSRIAVPTSIQAGWALVAAAGSLVGVVGSGVLLLRRRGDRYARAALALFCVCLGAAWGGGLVTGTTQILLLWVPHDRLTASCKATFLASVAPSSAPQGSQCSRRLYALLGIYVGVLLAWGVLAGALLEAQRRICRGLSGEMEMATGERHIEAKVDVTRERATPPVEAGMPTSTPRPQVTFVVDPWHGHGHQQGHPAMASRSPQRHPTILRPASARSTPTASVFSSPALSSTSSLSSARTLVWSSSPAAAQKYLPYSSTTPSRSSLLSKSPIVY